MDSRPSLEARGEHRLRLYLLGFPVRKPEHCVDLLARMLREFLGAKPMTVDIAWVPPLSYHVLFDAEVDTSSLRAGHGIVGIDIAAVTLTWIGLPPQLDAFTPMVRDVAFYCLCTFFCVSQRPRYMLITSMSFFLALVSCSFSRLCCDHSM